MVEARAAVDVGEIRCWTPVSGGRMADLVVKMLRDSCTFLSLLLGSFW